jgi:hypothetical protein
MLSAFKQRTPPPPSASCPSSSPFLVLSPPLALHLRPDLRADVEPRYGRSSIHAPNVTPRYDSPHNAMIPPIICNSPPKTITQVNVCLPVASKTAPAIGLPTKLPGPLKRRMRPTLVARFSGPNSCTTICGTRPTYPGAHYAVSIGFRRRDSIVGMGINIQYRI